MFCVFLKYAPYGGNIVVDKGKNVINKWFDRFTDLNLALCGFGVKSKHSFYHISLKWPFFQRIVVSDCSECKQDKLSLEQKTTFGINGKDPASSQ